MADKTGIEWTDATWNPVTGCTKVSQGCKNCYAERDWARLVHLPAYIGRSFSDVRTHADRLDQPLRWKKPRRIFVNSMSDLFHESVPYEFIDQAFAVMALCPQHTFQVLTKRAERMFEYLSAKDRAEAIGWAETGIFEQVGRLPEGVFHGPTHRRLPLPNVWLGVSVENQDAADERIPLLLQTPAAVRWISIEPLLGPVDLTDFDWTDSSVVPRSYWQEGFDTDDSPAAPAIDALTGQMWQRFGEWSDSGERLDWVIVGGESGPKARPMHPDWVRSLRDQCADAGVPFLFKQWGEWAPDDQFVNLPRSLETGMHEWFDGDQVIDRSWRYGKKRAGRMLDSVQHDGYPEAIK